MGLFKKNDGGLMDMIRCDESSYLIWKWHPKGTELNSGNRENSIRLGSSLRVKDGEVAVFVYKQKDGTAQDFIVGPYDGILQTKNLPILASIIGLVYDGGTPFQAEVYFINLAQIIQVKFAVPYFDVYDPRFADFGVPVAVRGTITFKIDDYRQFVKLHRLNDFNLIQFQNQIRDAVSRYTKDVVMNAPAQNDIPLIQLETKIALINDVAEYDISQRLGENFGVVVSGVDIAAIDIDKTSSGYQQLMAITKDVVTAKIEAQTLDYTERLRIQREEEQYAMHKGTQSGNLGAFQVEKQTEVGIAGAEALGKMGENGAGGISLGSGAGFNPASMMAGIAMGSAVGHTIADTMNGAMQGNSSNMTTSAPPIPVPNYHVVIDGKDGGSFDITTLKQMAENGTITRKSLMWKPGMDEWKELETITELSSVCKSIPPEIK